MDNKTTISDELKELMEVYGLTGETLARYLSLSEDQVIRLSEGDTSFLPAEPLHRFQIFSKISFLYLSAVEDQDEKLRAFIDVLISKHRITISRLAEMSSVPVSDIDHYLASPPRDIPEHSKYQIAITVVSLRYFLKECEPV